MLSIAALEGHATSALVDIAALRGAEAVTLRLGGGYPDPPMQILFE